MKNFWTEWRFVMSEQWHDYALWILLPLVLIVGYEYLSDMWQVDTAFQNHFYFADRAEWVIEKNNRPLRLIFYHTAKYSIVAFGVFLIAVILRDWIWPSGTLDHKAVLFVIVCLIVVPSIMGGLKSVTGIACPYQLQRYGGALPYHTPFDMRWPEDFNRLRCFPAGHPSGGFALLALVLVSTRKKITFALALASGFIMSAYQIARGAHFLSHCVVTLLLSVSVIALIHLSFSIVSGMLGNNRGMQCTSHNT